MASDDILYAAGATLLLALLTYMMYRSAMDPKWAALSKKEKAEWKKGK